MRITNIQLENIKSYRRVSIPLSAGTVAIRGHNGAGKSTLVEAIGFALFDALSYDQSQFVREGERAGTVTITFISALDDREYQAVRRCGSSPSWYIYDPELHGRVVEQKTDVTDFLRKHLRLEAEMTLKDLFADALGVPQGTFTADFLLTPTNRKKKFDALLQVEDYRKAAEKLADTRTYLQEERRATETRITALERETAQLTDWREQLDAYHQNQRALDRRLTDLQAQSSDVARQLTALRQQQTELVRLESELRVAAANTAAADASLRDADKRLADARAAERICAAARADHDAHNTAQERYTAATERARQRDTLNQQRAAAAQRLAGARRDLQHTQEQFTRAQACERRIVELAPAANRQAELERQREEARNAAQRHDETIRQRERATATLANLASEIAAAEQAILALEALRPEANLLEERREHVSLLQDIRAQYTEKQRRLKALLIELDKLTQRREKQAKEDTRARENVRKLLASREDAESLPHIEAQHTTADSAVRELEARQRHHMLSREQSGAGSCPFLREPCQNIRQRGENSLSAYFDQLILADEAALTPARAQLVELTAKLERVRTVRHYYDQLPHYQEAQQRAADALADADDNLAHTQAERVEIEEWLAGSPDQNALTAAQVAFKRSDDADKGLRELAPRQAGLQRLYERQIELERERSDLQALALQLEPAHTTLRAIDADLAALGTPRNEIATLEREASQRPLLEQQVATYHASVADLAQQVATLDTALLPFATLDAELLDLTQTLSRTRPSHIQYQQHIRDATNAPMRATEAAAALAHAQTQRETHTSAERAVQAMRAIFDPKEVERKQALAEQLAAELARLAEELRHILSGIAQLEHEITRVELLLGALAAARDERDQLKATEDMLQQFRDTIKEAGPHVMRALLKHISQSANRIYGEIMGDRSGELEWRNDYEITLRRDGRERSFAQLSGGEQMSAALAVRLALLRNLTRLDIAFFDEPTQNMDGERRGNLAEQIRRVRGFDQLIVISHDDTFEQGLDSVIHLEKHNGETVLAESDALVLA